MARLGELSVHRHRTVGGLVNTRLDTWQKTEPAGPPALLPWTNPVGRSKAPVTALRGLSFPQRRGASSGCSGGNGAGKSTTVKILSTLSVADSRSARVAGIDVHTGDLGYVE